MFYLSYIVDILKAEKKDKTKLKKLSLCLFIITVIPVFVHNNSAGVSASVHSDARAQIYTE
jgi:hypothetical protein